ncbi:unnamed protein product [Lupinus luteus]|uniref:Uncharacterized protein n=1 Tax=Lupinus luteus TaxID=3873 RepID=A0AAV1Y0E8_LUPLU
MGKLSYNYCLFNMCISKNVASTWHPCSTPKESKVEEDSHSNDTESRNLLQYLNPMS